MNASNFCNFCVYVTLLYLSKPFKLAILIEILVKITLYIFICLCFRVDLYIFTDFWRHQVCPIDFI